MKKKSLFAALLCGMALLGFCACGGSEETAALPTVTVYADAQVGGAFVRPYGEITVSADAAENNGFTDQVSADTAVSALDVMVALHEELFGEDFTADPAAYMQVDGGWINGTFENSGDSWSVIYNGESAHSDTESAYGGFEALTVDQTEVKDGDVVEFVAYQDTENYSDYALWICSGEERITALETEAGAAAELTVSGYSFGFYGSFGTDEIRASYLEPVKGVQLALMAEDGTLTALDGAFSDENGKVSFTLEETGTYTVVACLPPESEGCAFMAALTVTVK